jgi:hypothetical protein
MITELTQEQKDKMPEYVDKWIGVGTDTKRLNYDDVLDTVHDFQEHILKQEKTPVIIFNNPLEAWVACNYAEHGFTVDKLKDCVKEYFEGTKPSWKIKEFVMPYFGGMFSANVFAFYDFFKYELGVVFEKDFEYEVWKRTSELGVMYNIFDVEGSQNMCIISEKPTKVSLNQDRVIHCEGGPAITYDGYGDIKIFALNGVVVPQWLAENHHSKIDPSRITEITNADIKAEFVRKIGVEKLLSMGKKIDSHENYSNEWWTKSEYELWDMSVLFDGVPYAPHVKMLNQTVKGVWHVEAVSPDCKTLEDAIKERFNDHELDIIAIR